MALTRKLVRSLVDARTGLGASLRGILLSPAGEERESKRSGSDPFPLPLPMACKDALRHFAECSFTWKSSGLERSRGAGKQWKKDSWRLCPMAWCGLMILALNTSNGFTTKSVEHVRSPLKKGALRCILDDAVKFVEGDGLVEGVLRRPEVPWSVRVPNLSVNYSGDIVEKARWLTWDQVEPGLPPPGKGGVLYAPKFCDPWVAQHLEDAEISRMEDDLVPDPLPHAVVRCTTSEWEKIAYEMVRRGVATVIEPCDIAMCRGKRILNGACGVTKPNKWVGDPTLNKPVLRLIMDFRAANWVHRMLPGSVSSLVGASKWQGFCLKDGEILLSSGDDLVAAFYLFRLPFSWSRYFAFRKPLTRRALGMDGDPEGEVFIASQVLPMGWAAAVTIMQHMHRNMALWSRTLPMDREIHRERPLPERSTEALSSYWNLYVDDLTLMEVISEEWFLRSGGDLNEMPELQKAMEAAYTSLGVPFSSDKASSRELRCEKLGALVDGSLGRLGVTTARALDFVTLGLYMMSQEKVPTRWFQILMGKYVHIVQFRRPLFSLVEYSWERINSFHSGGPLTNKEVDEWFTLFLTLPLAYTDLRAKLLRKVSCSDASPSGGGLCISTGVSPLGELGRQVRTISPSGVGDEILTIEWFAGIGGMSRALERLGLRTFQTAVCECDENCLQILRQFLPGCEVWRDIRAVGAGEIRAFFDRYPNAKGVIQSGGSPCQGLSRLSSERLHFDDERSGLFYELVHVMALVEAEATRRRMWHSSFVENVVCDWEDQKIFREQTGWSQWLMCSGSCSVVKRPRFFWISDEPDFEDLGLVEPSVGYRVCHLAGRMEDCSLWVSPGWKWVSEDAPCNLPTFTRSIPRAKPPVKPAGIGHTGELAKERWVNDWHRYPPYTYKESFCMERNGYLRVACACEREALMGFSPGHTRLRKRKLTEDERCSMLGNSFHTTVVAGLLRGCLVRHFPWLRTINIMGLIKSFEDEMKVSQKEVYAGHGKVSLLESDETWLDRLEQQSEAVRYPLGGRVPAEVALVLRLVEQASFRGTDVHVDTMSFFRPDRLPRASVDARQWHWKVAKGWKWRFEDHINILEMEALFHSVRFRAKSLRLFHSRFVHLVDSQVVLGVAAKGRTSSRRLRKSLHRYNMLVLVLHTWPLLGWVLSHLNPSDAPSRWYEKHPS